MGSTPRAVPLSVILVLAAGCLAPAADVAESAAADAAPRATFDFADATWLRAYVRMDDGVTLRVVALVPGEGRFPTLVEYGPYAPPYHEGLAAGFAQRYVEQGYAVVGVQMRGTGCSGGAYDPLSPRTAADGAAAVEWAAAQPWSTGNVGMVGWSYHGITQVMTAAERPPSLRAITASGFPGDVYRDVFYPGGVLNAASIAAAEAGVLAFPARYDGGWMRDESCAGNFAPQDRVAGLGTAQVLAHPFDGPPYDRFPPDIYARVEVPIFTVHAWQDELVLPRVVHAHGTSAGPWWLHLSNGDHSLYGDPPSVERMDAFLARFVKGEANGFDAEPPVTVDWELRDDLAHGWTTTHVAWPPPEVRPWRLNLTEGGALVDAAGDGRTAWLAALPAPPNPHLREPQAPPLPAAPTRVAWRSAPMPEDVALLGSANLTLWIRTLAPDVDVQATVREVRDDGTAVLVQRGWLRASHRAVDPARSTALAPWHPHDRAEALPSGEPALLAVEILPFGHVFRAGTRLEVALDAPQVVPELYAFVSARPALVEILHDEDHPSALVLPRLHGAAAQAPAPPCGALMRQPCERAG